MINRVSIMSKAILRIQCGWQFELYNFIGSHEALIGVQTVHAKDIVSFKKWFGVFPFIK